MKWLLIFVAGAAVLFPGTTPAANLANPAVILPEARAAVGVSYNLGFHTITNRYLPSVMNRVHARGIFAPSSFFNIGIDLGASQMDVAGDTTSSDTLGIFHGKMGFSGGGHIKLATPFFFEDRIAVVGMATGTYFRSTNENDAWYGGVDGTGALGIQFHVPGFGYVTAGAQMYLIQGKNQDYQGNEGTYANSENLRGWLAIDYFPKIEVAGESRPYISFEFSVSPEADFISEGQPPFREVGFSISVGSVTKRLWGKDRGLGWEP